MTGKIVLHLMVLFALLACSRTPKYPEIPRNSTVVALGDSLTYGYGASPDAAYPRQLAAATGWQVVNAGVSGNTSAQALQRLPALLAQHQPRMVIICIGGNDFLQRIPESETQHNIKAMIEMIRAQYADILLIGVPQFTPAAVMGNPKDHPLYQTIAQDTHVQLYSNGWSKILKDSSLRSDQVHPNAAGYHRFSNALVQYLQDSGRVR